MPIDEAVETPQISPGILKSSFFIQNIFYSQHQEDYQSPFVDAKQQG